MKVEIKTKNIENESMVREFVDRKVHFALDRIAARIDTVVVRLEDETKESPMFDGICRIEVNLVPSGHVHVSANGDSVFDCALVAIRKMEHAVKHDIDRHRTSARVRHEKSKRDILDSLSANSVPPIE